MVTNLHSESKAAVSGSTYAFLIAFVAAVGGFLFGYDLVIISGAQIFLKQQFHLSDEAFGFATGSAGIGCMMGPFLGSILCDRIGRKKTLFLASLLFGISAIGTALPQSITVFNIFRIMGGVGVGLCSLASPMYIVEVSPARMRGSLGLMYQLAICIGALFSVIVAYFLAKMLPETVAWRWMFGSVAVPVLVFVIFLLIVPESPRWLAEVNRFDEARAVLRKIESAEYADKELEQIKSSMHQEQGRWSELLAPGMRMALLVGVLMAIFNNWTGWTGIAYYLPTLFQKAGQSSTADAIGRTIWIFAGNIGLTLVAIWLVDKIGRRPLWISTALLMTLFTALAGLVFHLNLNINYVLFAVFLCAIPHAVGIGALPWLMMSELYPTKIRAKAVAVTTTVIWVAGTTAPMAFPVIAGYSERTIGSVALIFWIYSAVSFCAFLFGLRMLPETRGRTLEEIGSSWVRH